jgi:hypothetical protein
MIMKEIMNVMEVRLRAKTNLQTNNSALSLNTPHLCWRNPKVFILAANKTLKSKPSTQENKKKIQNKE